MAVSDATVEYSTVTFMQEIPTLTLEKYMASNTPVNG